MATYSQAHVLIIKHEVGENMKKVKKKGCEFVTLAA
jgi:hypothetical protein